MSCTLFLVSGKVPGWCTFPLLYRARKLAEAGLMSFWCLLPRRTGVYGKDPPWGDLPSFLND